MSYIRYGRSILRQIRSANDPSASLLRSSSDVELHHPLFYAAQGVRYRKLEVILTTSIDKLGKAGETVKVAPGYFRNYLMPKLLAVPNIDKFRHLIDEQRKIYQPKEVEEIKVVPETQENKMLEYQKAANRLDSSKLVIRKLMKADNEVREPVTKDEIIAEVARQLGISIAPENLHLPTPLSIVGEHEVPLRLPRSIPLPESKVQWALKVKIRKIPTKSLRKRVLAA